jgi:hypothetical protein
LLDGTNKLVAVWPALPCRVKHLANGTPVAIPPAGGRMKTTFWSLIVIAPNSPSLHKVRVTGQALMILAGAFVLAFCTTVLLLLMFPRIQVNDIDRSRLATENQVLRIENKNLTVGMHKLDSKLSRMEGRSQQVAALMQTD